jgi:hypothetical protein
MDQNSGKRCPHFQIYSEPLELDGPPAYLAVRRCLLTERMISLLNSSVAGKQLAQKLVVHATNGRTFAFVGPDFEAVTQRACTLQRCAEQCTPAYTHNLDHFGIVDLKEETVTCDDEEPEDRHTDAEVKPCPCG